MVGWCREISCVSSLFFLPFKKIFNLSITALQCCVGFCHTTTWISHKYTHVHSVLNLLPTLTQPQPSRSSESTELSSLCYTVNFHWLSILHMVIYMFQCYSLSICPTFFFSWCVHMYILYICVSILALFVFLFVHRLLSLQKSMWDNHMSVSLIEVTLWSWTPELTFCLEEAFGLSPWEGDIDVFYMKERVWTK